MGITFTDVYGDGRIDAGSTAQDDYVNYDNGSDNGISDNAAYPVAVPEPTTLILLAGGLSALYVARRRRQ